MRQRCVSGRQYHGQREKYGVFFGEAHSYMGSRAVGWVKEVKRDGDQTIRI